MHEARRQRGRAGAERHRAPRGRAGARHVVTVALSADQQIEIERLLGARLDTLTIAVEDLVDLGDLVVH